MFDAQHRRKTVFDNEQALSTTNRTEPIGRDDELETIADAVRPIAHGNEPDDLLIYGPAGTGKTTCITHVFDNLDTETPADPVTINCWDYNTRSAILTQLLIELGYPAPRKGKPVDELLGKLREWLDKNDPVAVALDEFDQLEDQNEIVYDLHNLSVNTDQHMAMLLVSNKPPSQIDLENRSQSRLGYRTLQFTPYDEDELTTILQKRAKEAFKSHVLGDHVVETVAKQAVEDLNFGAGDCRHAIEILHRAGREADQAQADKVTAAHVERAINPLRRQAET